MDRSVFFFFILNFSAEASTTVGMGQQQRKKKKKILSAHNQISYSAKLRIKPPALAGGGLVLAETLESFAVMAWYTL